MVKPIVTRVIDNPFAQLGQQATLPLLRRAELIPRMFDDSTHQLWFCDTDDGEMILKIAHQQNVDESAIWQVMQQLFDVYLPQDLACFDQVYQQLAHYGTLQVPDLVAWGGQHDKAPAFVLTRLLPGQTLSNEQVNNVMVVQLARHVAAMHSQQQKTWGRLYYADRTSEIWPEYLLKTLVQTCKRYNIGDPWLPLAIGQIEQVMPATFVPIMVDNRWDQFLAHNGKISALVDLDAFVMGPAELELVLLEYQLDTQQAQLFATEYQHVLPLPDLSGQRLIYRLLLFVMNALGETDLDKWMQHPTHF